MSGGLRMRALRGLAVALVASAIFGCGVDVPPAVSSQNGGGFGTQQAIDAEAKAAFEAIRRYTSYSGLVPASYTERFVKDQDRKSKVELLALNDQTLSSLTSQGEIEHFQNTQALLAGGAGRYVASGRDFAVRNLDRFLQNYTFQIIPGGGIVAGRNCIVAEVKPKHLDRPSYVVWADAEHYTTLRYIERLPSGAVVAEMETTKVDFSFDAKDESFPASAATAAIDVSASNWSGLVGFEAFEASYLPAGFVADGVKLSTIAGREVLAMSFNDGAQELFIAQYREIDQSPVAPPVGYPADAPVHVRVNVLGAVVNSLFVIDSTQIHVKCKIEPDELMTVIESLAPAGP
jgi:negative regulator of sigma E activity